MTTLSTFFINSILIQLRIESKADGKPSVHHATFLVRELARNGDWYDQNFVVVAITIWRPFEVSVIIFYV